MRYNKAITENQLKQVNEPGLSYYSLVLLLVIIIVNYVFATAS